MQSHCSGYLLREGFALACKAIVQGVLLVSLEAICVYSHLG